MQPNISILYYLLYAGFTAVSGGFVQPNKGSQPSALFDSARMLRRAIPLQHFGWECMMFSNLQKTSVHKRVDNSKMKCFVIGCIGLHEKCVSREASNNDVGQRRKSLQVSAPGVKNWMLTGGGFQAQGPFGQRKAMDDNKLQVKDARFVQPAESDVSLRAFPSFSWDCKTAKESRYR